MGRTNKSSARLDDATLEKLEAAAKLLAEVLQSIKAKDAPLEGNDMIKGILEGDETLRKKFKAGK